MDTLPVELAQLICRDLDARVITRLAVLSTHWRRLPRRIIHQRLVIHSHRWTQMKPWVEATKPRCQELVLINSVEPIKNQNSEILKEMQAAMQDLIDPTFVRRLALYDILDVNLSEICVRFPKLEVLKLYRGTHINAADIPAHIAFTHVSYPYTMSW